MSRPSRERPEQVIQRAVFDHLRARGPWGVRHPTNGGYRKPIEAAIMKGLGVKASVPDMEAASADCCIAEGLDRAIAVLEVRGILRGWTV